MKTIVIGTAKSTLRKGDYHASVNDGVEHVTPEVGVGRLMLQIGMACLAGAVLATLVALFATGNAGPRAVTSVASIPAPMTSATQSVTVAALPSAAETTAAVAAESATVSATVEPTKGAVTLPPNALPTQPPPVVPTYVPVYVPAPSSTPLPLPISTRLTGLKFERQLFNNCGPATISMLINALGEKTDQTEAMGVLRPVNGPTGDRNVNPDELQAYAATKNIQTRLMVGGTVDDLKRLVALGVPVIVETWYVPFPNDEMGHYQLLVGFDGDDLVFYDSFHGPNVTLKTAEFDALWRVFNRKYLVGWSKNQPPFVQTTLATLSETLPTGAMFQRALDKATQEQTANPKDKWAWWNIGTNLLAIGDVPLAARAFDTARKIGLPWRTMWYQFGPYEAYYRSGRYDDVIALANETLARVSNLEESYYWRGRAQAAKGNAEFARRDLQTAVALNPNYAAARSELR